jgi:hypothetical protein
MSAKDLLILHGEKAVVGVVGALCLWTMYGAMTNQDIRAAGGDKGMSADKIKDAIAFIDNYRREAKPPILKTVPAYADRLATNLGTPLVPDRAVDWLTAHPDLGPVIQTLNFYYVYEAMPPKITAVDRVGSVELEVSDILGIRDFDRIFDGDSATATRNTGAKIDNHADVIGAMIERQDGDNWIPVGDMVPYEKFGAPIAVTDVKEYGSYNFRARLVIAATGFPFRQADGAGSMLVLDGRALPEDADADAASAFMARVNLAVGGDPREAELNARFIRPGTVKAAELQDRELAYLGPWSDPVSVTVSSSIRFQLDKLAMDPTKEEATFLLTKLMRDETQQAWVEVQKFVVEKPNKLGGVVLADNPLTEIVANEKIDLTTPFVLTKVTRDVERTIYYEIKEKARTDGEDGKMLELRTKTTKTDTATVKNTLSGAELVLVKLGRITPPVGANRIIDPPIEGGDEEQWFRTDPAAFEQAPLVPKAPVKFEPGTGPLAELNTNGNNLAKTNTPYYELSTGELIWYEPLNKTVMRAYKVGAEPVAPKVYEVPMVDPGMNPDMNPGAAQPGNSRRRRGRGEEEVPPGMEGMPPDGMPPGMPPEFMNPESMPPGVQPDAGKAPRRR